MSLSIRDGFGYTQPKSIFTCVNISSLRFNLIQPIYVVVNKRPCTLRLARDFSHCGRGFDHRKGCLLRILLGRFVKRVLRLDLCSKHSGVRIVRFLLLDNFEKFFFNWGVTLGRLLAVIDLILCCGAHRWRNSISAGLDIVIKALKRDENNWEVVKRVILSGGFQNLVSYQPTYLVRW